MNVCLVFTSKVAGTRKVQRNYELVFGSHVVSPGHRLDTGSDLGSASKPVEGTMKRLKFNRPKYGRCNIHLRCQCLQKVCMQNVVHDVLFASKHRRVCWGAWVFSWDSANAAASWDSRAWSWVLIFLCPCKSPGYGTGFNFSTSLRVWNSRLTSGRTSFIVWKS